MIRLENINLGYRKPLIENGTIEIYPGLVTLLRGPTGCGKTTLLYEIGMLYSNHADYYFNDTLISTHQQRTQLKRNQISIVFQDNLLFEGMSIKDNLCLYAKMNDQILTDEMVLDYLELVRLKIDMNQDVKMISGGERQRVAIACALAKEPSLLILDEPTSALDMENEKNLYLILREIASKKDVAIVISSHSTNAPQYCDRIYRIKDRKLLLEKDTINEKRMLKSKEEKKNTFTSFYIKKHHQALKNVYKLLKNALMLILALALISNLYVHVYQKSHEETLDALSANKILINAPGLDIEEDFPDAIKYMFYYINVFSNQGSLSIYSYYPEDRLDDYVEKVYDSNKEPVYISYHLARELLNNEHFVSIQNDSYLYEFDITHVLSYSAKNLYPSQNYILVSPERMKTLKGKEWTAYMTYFESFKETLAAKKKIDTFDRDLDLYRDYDASFQEMALYESILTSATLQSGFVQIVLNMLFVFMTIMILIQYIKTLNPHLVLLKSNGIERIELIKVMFKIIHQYYLKIMFVLCGVSVLSFLILKSYLAFVYGFILLLLLYVVIVMSMLIYVYRMKIVDSIRM